MGKGSATVSLEVSGFDENEAQNIATNTDMLVLSEGCEEERTKGIWPSVID